MTDQVRTLEPPTGTTDDAGVAVDTEPRPPALSLLLTSLALVVTAGVLWMTPPAVIDLGIEPIESFRPDVLPVTTTVATLPPVDAEAAIATVQQLGRSINLGDSASVLQLLAPQAPRRTEFRRAEWPMLPTDASWWHGGFLDKRAVEGSVRYVFTVPGSVFLDGCGVDASPPVMGEVTVTCDYVASGGALSALGQEPEIGHVHVMLLDGLVAGIERHGTTDRPLWAAFARWALDNESEAFFDTLGTNDGRLFIDPVYSGDSALIHVGLAETMASVE